MTQILRQSTAVDVLIGPFVDIIDGATSETGESPSVKLSKNGQGLAAKNDATTPVHDADGYHNCEFDATDTNTVGTMVLTVAASASALPVRHEFQVVEEDTYDFIYASGAAPDTQVQAIKIVTDKLDTAQAEPGQGTPAVNETPLVKLAYLFKQWRNKSDNDGATTQLYNDNTTIVDQKRSTSESAGTVTKNEVVTGP